MRDSCVFYRSFFEAIKVLPKENQAEIYNAIFEHAFNFNEVELEGINLTVMTLIKPQINANIRKYENGKKPKSSTSKPKDEQTESKIEAKDKQNESKVVTNVNDNVNVNVNVNENDNDNVQTAIVESVNRSLVAGEMPIREIAKEIAEGNQHGSQREAIMNEHRIKKIEVFKWALSLFNRHKRSLGQLTSTHSNYSFHLNNWLRKQDIQAIHQDYYQEIKRQTEKQ